MYTCGRIYIYTLHVTHPCKCQVNLWWIICLSNGSRTRKHNYTTCRHLFGLSILRRTVSGVAPPRYARRFSFALTTKSLANVIEHDMEKSQLNMVNMIDLCQTSDRASCLNVIRLDVSLAESRYVVCTHHANWTRCTLIFSVFAPPQNKDSALKTNFN